MDKTPLYQEIAEAIRQEILYGVLKPSDELPPVRDMARQWHCAPGTIQRAYQELTRQGLVISRPGQGTRIAALSPAEQLTPLRRANLVHEAEAFLLHFLSEGYSVPDIEQAMRLALDRWRVMAMEPALPPSPILRFIGSHDPAVSLLAAQAPGCAFDISFAGSLGGLIALAECRADLAGIHLWDAETDTYNIPFVQRLLPGRRTALITLAHRRLGLIVPPGNPAHVTGLHDMARPELRFVNRQRGAGTRVWLDAQLRVLQIAPEHIKGYENNTA
ncbi:MAG TPA: substrate-binding domain-containing protein, partial [Aggregatilineaceae bacterium]|nr:substrate-binding domain-containing protein [Aggregatilineaceae bacterium]